MRYTKCCEGIVIDMKILVTGGAGFIGSHIVERLCDAHDVVVLDDERTGRRENIDGMRAEMIVGSILDTDLLDRVMVGVERVFHLAAMVSVPESVSEPVTCTSINTIGLLNVLEAAARHGVKKLCFSSSAAIYGDDPTVPKHEDMPPQPASPYAITKLDGEYYCRLYSVSGRLNTASMRYFNVYGPRQDPRSHYAAAVPIFICNALRNAPLTIYGDGTQTRDFVYVTDVVNANIGLAMQTDIHGVFNVASGMRITIDALAREIIALCGSRSEIRYAEARPGDVKHSVAATSRLAGIGIEPTCTFSQGLKATIAYFRDRKTRS